MSDWHIGKGEEALGPFSFTEVKNRMRDGEISPADFVWKHGWSTWIRITDCDEFVDLLPSAPPEKLIEELARAKGAKGGKAMPPERPKSIKYFLYFDQAQYGPFSSDELKKLLDRKKIDLSVPCWTHGMEDWKPLGEMDLVSGGPGSEAAMADPSRTIELRGTPRKPLVAKILVADGENVIVGVCRDLSVGGMQVLTDQIPGNAGSRIRINVSPAPTSGGAGSLAPFVAEGIIVRVLSQRKGFSFRFENLKASVKDAIEAYLRS